MQTQVTKAVGGRPPKGKTKLARWLREHADRWTREGFAEELGIAKGSLDNYCSGSVPPPPPIKKLIQWETGGEVRIEDWEE